MISLTKFKRAITKLEKVFEDVYLWCPCKREFLKHHLVVSGKIDEVGTPFYAYIECECGKKKYISPEVGK